MVLEVKSFAYYDVIGINKATPEERSKMFLEFWKQSDLWINGNLCEHFFKDPLPVEGRNNETAFPECKLGTFSDSALLMTVKEHPLINFYDIATRLKEHYEKTLPVYCIINKDELISYEGHALGGGIVDKDGKYMYNAALGSGAVWVDIYEADQSIRKNNDWKKKYSFYAVGETNLINKYKPKDSIPFKGFNGSNVVYALL